MNQSPLVWPPPRSLTTTCGISVDFFSCGYLDVSVPHVSPRIAMDSLCDTRVFTPGGFPHSEICGSQAVCASPQLIAACHVLLRLLVPRHPPCALTSLTCKVSPLSRKNMSQHIRFRSPAMPSTDMPGSQSLSIMQFSRCYRILVEIRRFELLTPCLQGRCSPN